MLRLIRNPEQRAGNAEGERIEIHHQEQRQRRHAERARLSASFEPHPVSRPGQTERAWRAARALFLDGRAPTFPVAEIGDGQARALDEHGNAAATRCATGHLTAHGFGRHQEHPDIDAVRGPGWPTREPDRRPRKERARMGAGFTGTASIFPRAGLEVNETLAKTLGCVLSSVW